jgi:hypothetical protein
MHFDGHEKQGEANTVTYSQLVQGRVRDAVCDAAKDARCATRPADVDQSALQPDQQLVRDMHAISKPALLGSNRRTRPWYAACCRSHL